MMSGEDKKSLGSYDDEPVCYCRRCLSLNIRSLPMAESVDVCDDCGVTDIGETDIEEWKRMYRERYGRDFVTKVVRKWPYWC